MKAATYYRYGAPEVLQIAEVPTPKPNKNQLLVRVHYATVNRTDTGFRSAEYFISRFWSGLFKPKNPFMGSEFAGEVVELGSEIQDFNVGERVFGFNDQHFGGNAEYLILNQEDAFAKIPEGTSYREAASLCEGSHYAWSNIQAAKVTSESHVLVYGATGSIGTAAVQLLVYLGARVTAVGNTKNIELIRDLGAHEVIDYQTQDFTKIPNTYDAVLDCVGKSSFCECRKLLKEKGVYISTELGKNGANVWLALFTPLGRGKRVLFPIPSIDRQYVEFIGQLAAQKKYKAVIDREYPLSDIVEAHRYVQSGVKTGNVLISI